MASVRTVFRTGEVVFNAFKGLISVRPYAVYPSYYVDPIWNPDDLNEALKKYTPTEIEAMRIKAPPNDATCSVFYDHDVRYFIRFIMRKGNKVLARSIVDRTFEIIKRKQLDKYYEADPAGASEIELDPKKIFHAAVANTSPLLTTKLIKRSGKFYKIPCPVMPKRAKFIAFKFLIEAAREKDKDDRIYDSLAEEFITAAERRGKAVRKKNDLHKYCEANRAYAHYRWT